MRSAIRSHTASPAAPRRAATAVLAPWLWLGAVMAVAVATVVALVLTGDAPALLEILDRPGRGVAARRLLIAAEAVLVVLIAVVTAAAARRLRRGAAAFRHASTAFLLRLSAYLAAGVLAAVLVADPLGRFNERPELAACFAAAAWSVSLLALAIGLLARPRLLSPPAAPWARILDIAAFTAVVVGAALEATLALLPRLSRSPLFQFDPLFRTAEERHVDETLRRFRLRPHVQFFDGLTNSGGYVDDEFFAAGPDDFVVAVISDSFGVGVVQPRFNFVAEVERRLQGALAGRYRRVAAHNFGVANADLPEYRRILLTEALPARPAVVVLCVFVGNDLTRPLPGAGLMALAALRNWRTVHLARRLWRLGVERAAAVVPGAPAPAPPGRRPRSGTLTDDAELPMRPRPLFLDIERQRLEMCNTASPGVAAAYAAARPALESFEAATGGELLVVLIPDEYQVNDELWAELQRSTETPESYDRTYPQTRLLAYCRELGIEVLDLLPALAEAERTGPTYRPNDTHWSRHGNAVAGATIADAILRMPAATHPP